MSIPLRSSLALLLVAGGTGCGGSPARSSPLPQSVVEAEQARQRELALTDLEHHQARLDSVAFPVLARATALCPGAVGYRVGMRVATVHQYEEPWREAAASALRLGDTLAVLGLVREGPAAEAGLRLGDRLLAVNGRPVPTGPRAAAAFAAAVENARRGAGRLVIAYRRAGERNEATVAMAPGCDYGTHVLVGGELNAYADGRNILVTSTMMRFAGDDELRVVVAHELAHHARGHIGTRQRGAMLPIPTSPGVTTGGYLTSEAARTAAPSFSAETEREADEVALYALAIAGFPLDPAPRFWRHVAQADPERIGMAATHPTPAERFVRMEQTIAEIERRRAAGVPLIAAAPGRPALSSPPTAEPTPAKPAPADRAADTADAVAPAARVRSNAELQLDQDLRETLRDVLRLGIAEAYEEADPGRLLVVLAPDAFSVSSTEYNLKRLYLAYDRATLWPESVSLELWQGGRMMGRYTRAGLLLGPDAEPPPPS